MSPANAVHRRSTGPSLPESRTALVVGALCAIVAVVMLGLRIVSLAPVHTEGPGDAFAPAYRPPTDRLEVIFNAHDGQAFASLAMDPLLRRPAEWSGGSTQLAYRGARPLIGWLAWAGSFGRPGAVEWSLAVISVLSVGLLGFATATIGEELGKRSERAYLILLLPGVLSVVVNPGLSDALGTALALIGAAYWMRGRRWPAVVLLGFAALCRDTCALMAIVLLIDDLATNRSPRRVAPLVLPPAVYLTWITIVRIRIGDWPTAYHGNLTFPLVGLAREVGDGWSVTGVFAALIVTALFVVALVRRPPRLVSLTILIYGFVALCSGSAVWATWDTGLTRSVLPAEVLALIWIALPNASRSVSSTQHGFSQRFAGPVDLGTECGPNGEGP